MRNPVHAALAQGGGAWSDVAGRVGQMGRSFLASLPNILVAFIVFAGFNLAGKGVRDGYAGQVSRTRRSALAR